MAFNDLFCIISSMRGFPFSVEDIMEHNRKVCFCLDGNMAVQGRCWYLAKMLSYDLNNYLSKSGGDKELLLVLDVNNKDKLKMFSEFMGIRRIKTIINVDNAEYFTENLGALNINELYIFSHPDINSAKYWSGFFDTHKLVEYTYSSNNNNPLFPFSIGSILGEASSGVPTSYRLVDKPVFEINEIRELSDSEFIYYNHTERKPIKYTLR